MRHAAPGNGFAAQKKKKPGHWQRAMQPPFALDSELFGKSFAPFSAEATRGLDTSRLALRFGALKQKT